MTQRVFTGIDIGTHQIKVVVAAPPEKPDVPMQILATASSTSRGLRHGYIVDKKEAARSIREAVVRASQAAKVPIRSARIAMGGISLEEIRSTAEVSLTASGGIVSDRDIERVLRESETKASSRLTNRAVVHVIPLEFRLDGAPLQGRPSGMQGTKLAVDALIVHMLAQHHDDLIEAVEAAQVEVEGTMASSLAASLVTLTKSQKTAGVVLANIGSETLSIVVFDNDIPVSLKVFPVGSAGITEALALNFQLPLNEAEQLKRGALSGTPVSQKKMSTVINARLKEMFIYIQTHLKSINRDRLLPAGIVITGGGAGLAQVLDAAKATLKLPANIGVPLMLARASTIDATWAVAFGLCRWGYAESDAPRAHPISEIFEKFIETIRSAIKSLMP